jgi:hypothetical protein
MKPNLLNSIYYKLSQTEEVKGLQNAVNNYTKKVFMLYLELLDQAGVDDLNERVKVKTEFANSKVLETECTAGEHLIEALLHSDDFEDEMKELDEIFLNSCQCNNKEGILHRIKAILSDVGSESIEQSDWLDAVDGMKNCEDFESEERFFDLDDF